MPYSYRSNSARTTNTNPRRRKPQANYSRSRSGGGGGNRQRIDPARFVSDAQVAKVEVYIPQNTFADFALHDILHTNLTTRGFEQPTPIQDQSIPAALLGNDILGMAGTGTGKTAAFALPVLQALLNDKQSAALIVAPTRELAEQIEADFRVFAQNSGLRTALLIGGSSMGAQLRDLRSSARLVIGTPGRIKDHFKRGTVRLNTFNLVVLDEVDRMLDMGFVDDVRTIMQQTADNRQSLFFSATMNPSVRRLVDEFVTDPTVINIASTKATSSVKQDVVRYQTAGNKIDQLHDLLVSDQVSKTIIFDETQRGVERLAIELQARGFAVDSMHGGKTQGQRQRALAKFKKSETTVLVATDVAARGLDVTDISHVINYSVPQNYDDYIHRIGRAGRAGRLGYAYTFLSR